MGTIFFNLWFADCLQGGKGKGNISVPFCLLKKGLEANMAKC
jgi:hypothetical protein